MQRRLRIKISSSRTRAKIGQNPGNLLAILIRTLLRDVCKVQTARHGNMVCLFLFPVRYRYLARAQSEISSKLVVLREATSTVTSGRTYVVATLSRPFVCFLRQSQRDATLLASAPRNKLSAFRNDSRMSRGRYARTSACSRGSSRNTYRPIV